MMYCSSLVIAVTVTLKKNPLVLQKLSLLGIINDAKMKTGTVANLFTGKNKNISGHGAL